MIPVIHKGQPVYMIDAELIYDGQKTMRVRFKGKQFFFPKIHCEFISPGRCAVKCEFYDMMFAQDQFKKTSAVKVTLHSKNRRRRAN